MSAWGARPGRGGGGNAPLPPSGYGPASALFKLQTHLTQMHIYYLTRVTPDACTSIKHNFRANTYLNKLM